MRRYRTGRDTVTPELRAVTMAENHSTPPVPPDKTATDTSPGVRAKPAKPDGFPLFPHATGRWAKKIRGQLRYFGSWDEGPEAALAKYLSERDDLHSGRKPKGIEAGGPATVRDLYNKFLNHKQRLVDSGELTQRSWKDYEAAADLIYKHFGRSRLIADIGPDDFGRLRARLAKQWGPVTLGNTINRIRVIFKFAFDDGMIDRPIRYGQSFKRPSRKTIRVQRAKGGAKLFTAQEIRWLLDAASVQLKAMILLGINGGLGNADCGTLPRAALDLDACVLDFPRPKTGIARRVPLWPETVTALHDVEGIRPEAKDASDSGLVFITKFGLPWAKTTADQTVAKEFGKLLHKLGINGRKGLGFYGLRHTFRTIGDEAKDQPAADRIMGHEIPHMSSVYRETISDARLRAVVEYVRGWLFADKGNAAGRKSR